MAPKKLAQNIRNTRNTAHNVQKYKAAKQPFPPKTQVQAHKPEPHGETQTTYLELFRTEPTQNRSRSGIPATRSPTKNRLDIKFIIMSTFIDYKYLFYPLNKKIFPATGNLLENHLHKTLECVILYVINGVHVCTVYTRGIKNVRNALSDFHGF